MTVSVPIEKALPDDLGGAFAVRSLCVWPGLAVPKGSERVNHWAVSFSPESSPL